MKRDFLRLLCQKKFLFEEIVEEFPFLCHLKQIPQNPEYHEEGNVFIHTKQVCDCLIHMEEWQSLTVTQQEILFAAALFHDIGKITCTKLENGKLVSPKHALKGAKQFRAFFYLDKAEEYALSFVSREKIAALIQYHGLPLWFLEKQEMEWTLIAASYCVDTRLLCLLAKADILGRVCRDKEKLLETVDLFQETLQELGCFSARREFFNTFTKFKYFYEKSVWYGDVVYDTSEFEVIMMMGMPLAGKDTHIKKKLSALPVVSLDAIREKYGLSSGSHTKMVVLEAKEQAKKYLRNKQSFVWNATNLNRKNRDSLCALFASYHARVKILYLEVPYKEILRRNTIRERTLPEKVLEKMACHFDMLAGYEGTQIEYIVQED